MRKFSINVYVYLYYLKFLWAHGIVLKGNCEDKSVKVQTKLIVIKSNVTYPLYVI